MENLVVINQSKKNSLDFDLEVEGVDTKNLKVHFVIKAKGYELSFSCKKAKDSNKCTLTIPPLPHLEKSTYPFYIAVIADGYYFEPLKGTVNVEGSHQIYASKPENKKEEKKETKKKAKKESAEPPRKQLSNEPSIHDIAARIMEQHEAKKKAAAAQVVPRKMVRKEVIVESKEEVEEKPKLDDKVREILGDIAPKKESPKKFSTFKKGDIVSR